eukprot:432538_1
MALFNGPNICDDNKIRPKQLIKLLKAKSTNNIVIIDLRDPNTDYKGGNIINAINIPYGEFIKSIGKCVNTYCDVDIIIFHCMYSKVRAPKACYQYLQYINKNKKDNIKKQLKNQNVYLLVGGFRKWMDLHYSINNELIDNFDLKYWKQELQDKYSKR